MSIDNLWSAGGIISTPLLGFSLLAIALIVERVIFWWRVKNGRRGICKEVLSLYRSDCGRVASPNKGDSVQPMYSASGRHRFAAINKLKQNAHLHLPIARIFLEVMELG
ncbi:MAG: hypothetical protein AAF383_23060 [Cyanobacteria bacterium P01_A01_bin.83]